MVRTAPSRSLWDRVRPLVVRGLLLGTVAAVVAAALGEKALFGVAALMFFAVLGLATFAGGPPKAGPGNGSNESAAARYGPGI